MTWQRMAVMSVAVLALAGVSFGQANLGGIRGTVADPSGALVAGASVTAVSLTTGDRRVTESTSAGNYFLPALSAGVYNVEVELTGFKKLVREAVTVALGEIRALDVELELGATTEVVEVVGSAPLLDKETTVQDTSINPRTYLDLPLNASGGRKPGNFMVLAPGVSGKEGQEFNYSVNGGQILGTQILIDGLDASQALGTPGDQSKTLRLPPEAFQEFTLVTTNYPAELSNGAGLLNFSVRSGTNALHGNLFEFLRNDKLDARSFFASDRAINRQNEYGGSVGGPVRLGNLYDGRNKTFFFFNLWRFSTRGLPATNYISVPPPDFRRGNFSALKDESGNVIPIYDPATTRSDGAGGFMRNAFPGNTIPAGRISPVSAKVVDLFAAPTREGFTDNFLEGRIATTDIDSYTMKFDHAFNAAHRLSWSGSRAHWNNFSCSNPCFDPVNFSGATSANNTGLPAAFMRANYYYIISPTVVFHGVAGINRHGVQTKFRNFGTNIAQNLGIGNVGNGPFPTTTIPPYQQMGVGGTGTNEIFQGTNINAAANLSVIRGRHNLKFGADWRSIRTDHDLPTNSGRFRFSRNETAFPSDTGRSNTGFALGSMLLGHVDLGDQHVQDFIAASKFGYWGAYIQDDFKMSPNFTWNLGVRWELYLPMYGVHDNYSIMDPTVPNPAAGGQLGAIVFAGSGSGRTGNRRLTPPIVKNNFGPRLGFAWSVTPRWVIRSAYGITYAGPLSAGTGSIREYHQGFSTDPVFQSTDAGVTPGFIWDDGFPEFPRPPFIDPGFGISSETGIGGSIALWDENASHPAYTQQWHFTIQRELAADWLLDFGYVGTKGTRLITGAFNLNQVHPDHLSLGGLLTRQIDDPAVMAAGYTRPYPGFQGSLAQSLRPFPQYLWIAPSANLPVIPFLGGAQVGNSSYHSLQVKLEKKFSKGLYLHSAYTWSKNITDSPSSMGGFFGTGSRNHYNRKLEKGISPVNLPHRFITAFNYELPFGPGKSFGSNATGVARKLLEGWQVNLITDYQSGTPLAAFANNPLPLFNDLVFGGHVGAGTGYPDAVGGASQGLKSGRGFDPANDTYLNIGAFADPRPGTFGNAPTVLTGVRGFASYNENFGLIKRTPITESINVEFRFELFNALNRHQFSGIRNNFSDPFNFGQVTGSSGGRVGQFAMKLNW